MMQFIIQSMLSMEISIKDLNVLNETNFQISQNYILNAMKCNLNLDIFTITKIQNLCK